MFPKVSHSEAGTFQTQIVPIVMNTPRLIAYIKDCYENSFAVLRFRGPNNNIFSCNHNRLVVHRMLIDGNHLSICQ